MTTETAGATALDTLAAELRNLPRYSVSKQHGASADEEGKYVHRDLVMAAIERNLPA